MLIKSLLSGALSVAMMFSSGVAFADQALNRDAELMDALRIIAARDGGWSAKDWQDFGYKVAKYSLIIAAVGGAGATAYYFLPDRGFMWKSINFSGRGLLRAERVLAKHGGSAAAVVVLPIIANNLATNYMAMNTLTEAERLRNAATPDARVYRSHLRQFFKLKLSEQFLIARQDPTMTDDLIRLARWIEAGHTSGLQPR